MASNLVLKIGINPMFVLEVGELIPYLEQAVESGLLTEAEAERSLYDFIEDKLPAYIEFSDEAA